MSRLVPLCRKTHSQDLGSDFTSQLEIQLPIGAPIIIGDPVDFDSYRNFKLIIGLTVEPEEDIILNPLLDLGVEFTFFDYIHGPSCSANACLSIDPLEIGLELPILEYEINENGLTRSGLLFSTIRLLRDTNNPSPDVYNAVQFSITNNISEIPLPSSVYGFISGVLFLASRKKLK